MKENDVRERVQAFLKNTVRLVVVPASMGIGLALIGCGSSDETSQDAGADVARMSGGSGGSSPTGGAGGSVSLYGAPTSYGSSGGAGGLPESHPAYMASLPDAGVNSGGMFGQSSRYAAPMVSGGSVSSSRSSLSGGSGGTLPNSMVTYGTPWSSSGSGNITSTSPSSSGGVPTGGAVPDAGPGFDGGKSDLGTGGTTMPVTRYGGIFPTSSS